MAAPTRSIAHISSTNLAPEDALLHTERYEWEAFSPREWPFRAGEVTGLLLTCRHCGTKVTSVTIAHDMLLCEGCGGYRFSIQKLAGRKRSEAEPPKPTPVPPTPKKKDPTPWGQGTTTTGPETGGARMRLFATPTRPATTEPYSAPTFPSTTEGPTPWGRGTTTTEPETRSEPGTGAKPIRKELKIFLWVCGILATLAAIIGGLLVYINSAGPLSDAVHKQDKTAVRLCLAQMKLYELAGESREWVQDSLDVAVHDAVRNGDADMVKLLQRHGADINRQGLMGYGVLESAIRDHDVNRVRFALEHGAIPTNHIGIAVKELSYHHNEQPLISLIQLLLQHGADVNACYTPPQFMFNGMTPLHYAADNGYEQVCQLLLQHGARVNACNKNQETPLHLAARNGHYGLAQRLLQHGADVNAVDTNGDSVLIRALRRHDEAMVRLLLEKGANPNLRNRENKSPLELAREYPNIVSLLQQYGATDDTLHKIINDHPDWEDPKNADACRKCCEAIGEHLRNGADPNALDDKGRTPLHLAAYKGCLPLCELLVKHGADVNAMTNNKCSVLHELIWGGQDLKTHSLPQILRWELHQERIVIALLLLGHGANPNSEDRPLSSAIIYGSNGMVLQLLACGANPNSLDKDGYSSPLFEAISWERIDIIRTLIEKGADVNFRNENGDTALKRAKKLPEKNRMNIIKLLKSYGAKK